MPTLSRRAATLTALGLITLSSSACGGTHAAQPTGSTTAQPAQYDISRVNSVKNDVPAGFTASPGPVMTLTRDDVDNARVIPFTQATYAPPQCRALIIPTYVEPVVGARAAILSAEGARGEIFVAAMQLPHPVEVSPPPTGCGHVAMSGSEESSGTAESVPAPRIEGVTTIGVKLKPALDKSPGGYVFTAAIGNQTSVAVMGGTDPDLHPQQLLSDLLVKAVAAVRG
jgi:hypothetical protein